MNLKHKIASLVSVITFIAVNGFSQSVLTNGLIAYYPFSGNANDASGNGNDGTVFGATLTTNRFGYSNQAYYFNGSSSYVTVPINSSVFSNDFTASVWFDLYDITNGFPTLFDEQGNSAFRESIVGQTSGGSGIGNLVAYSSYAPATFAWFLETQQPTPTGQYSQAVVTKAGTNVTIYWNGQIAATSQVSNTTFVPGQFLKIGRQDVEDVPGDTAFHGVIEDIRIYNRALSSNEVAQLNTLESAPVVNVHQAVYLDSANLWVGTNYQVQVSSNLVNWTNYGAVFTATNTYWRSTNYWDVANWNQLFFRVITSP
jgi:hypothetical protein